MALLKGILVGLGTVVFIGPVFFTLLKNSIQRGVLSGLLTAFGILVSDIAVAALCYYLAADFIGEYVDHPYTKFIGASILLSFGISFYIRPIQVLGDTETVDTRHSNLKSFLQGFLVNFANPTVFVIWIGFVAIGESLYTSASDLNLYIVGILFGIFITDASKAVGAAYLARYIHSSRLALVYKLIGLILCIVGFYLVYQGFTQLI